MKYFYRRLFLMLVLAAAIGTGLPAKKAHDQATLRREVEAIARSIDGKLGVALLGLETRETFLFNGNDRFPMQSVYKFPLAMAVLERVDKGQFSLNQVVHVASGDLLPDTWSPLRERYPEGNIDIALSELLRFTVSQSDNNGCDILFRMLGGPPAVDAYVRGLGIKGMAIAATEEEMHRVRESQFSNWCEPAAMARLLDLFFQGRTHSAASRGFLLRLMLETATGPKRIKGLLPPGTAVAHKTGTSFTDEKGVTAATNDVGIVTVAGGKHVAMVISLADSSAALEARENAIARVARAGHDHFSPAEPGEGTMGAGRERKMVKQHFQAEIKAAREKVWATMLAKDTYEQWTKAFSPNSTFAGDWSEGSAMRFWDPGMGGGTKALVERAIPFELMRMRHVAMIATDGSEDVGSPEAKRWVGALEQYRLSGSKGVTLLTVDIEAHADFASVFSDGWPRALELLKALCEGES